MSATLAPAGQALPAVDHFMATALPAVLIAIAVLSTVWIDRGGSIEAVETAVEPSPSAMF